MEHSDYVSTTEEGTNKKNKKRNTRIALDMVGKRSMNK